MSNSKFDPDPITLELPADWWSSDNFKEGDSESIFEEPQDNIGRSTCYWCSEPTVKKPLLSTFYDYCEKCKK
jgi:hypothetical protein